MDKLIYLNSSKNKEFLWNLLYEKKVFNNIPNNMVNNIKEIFENSIKKTIQDIVNNNNQNKDLIELNKNIVKNLNDDFRSFKINFLKSNDTKNNYINEKSNLFNLEFEKQKKNMDDVLILKKPEEIDFSDKKLDDKPIDTNMMNNILEKMEKERNIILNNVKNDNPEIINELNNVNVDVNEINNDNVDKLNNINLDVDDKIFTKNIISNNITMIKKEESKKISNLEDLLNIEENSDNFENNIDVIENKKNEIKKRNSKVGFKDINNVMDNEYKYENIVNLSNKINDMYKSLNLILNNQEKIMKKLEI